MRPISSVSDACAELFALQPPPSRKMSPDDRAFRVARMRLLLERFGHPDRAYRVIHLAGTKGKGSTAAFIAAILEAAGQRVGLYASPHVSDPAERVAASEPLTDAARLTAIVRDIRELLAAVPPDALPGGFEMTPFELITLFAFIYFRETRCDFAVIETGIGGRCDVTNVVQPIAAVLTPIDYDHTDILGGTLAAIAREKAGIIKPETPAFCGFQPPEALAVFREVSAARHVPLRLLSDELAELAAQVDRRGVSGVMRFNGKPPRPFHLRLPGRFQAENAALAALAAQTLFPEISDAAITQGLAAAFLPGRMEILGDAPPVALDGAHTPLAVRRALEAFGEIFQETGILLFGAVAGKNYAEMARLLAPAFPDVIISTPGAFKQSDPAAVHHAFQRVQPAAILEPDPAAALRRALSISAGRRPILVTGSFYMVAEIRALLL